LTKNFQPFEKNFSKTVEGIFFDSHCILGCYLDQLGASGRKLPPERNKTQQQSRS